MEEQKMTEIDISKVLIEGDTATIMGVKYKRVEEPKSPAEEAYKEVYGWYPPTDPSVSNFEENRWESFQIGYKAAKEDWKVGEEPKPESLEDILWEWWEDAFTTSSNLDMEATLAGLADKVYSWHEKLQ
jgi:hypothetical protein